MHIQSYSLHASAMLCREKQEYEQLEAQIDQLTVSKDALEAEISQCAVNDTDYHKVLEMSERLAGLAAEIEGKTERWLELSDIADAQ